MNDKGHKKTFGTWKFCNSGVLVNLSIPKLSICKSLAFYCVIQNQQLIFDPSFIPISNLMQGEFNHLSNPCRKSIRGKYFGVCPYSRLQTGLCCTSTAMDRSVLSKANLVLISWHYQGLSVKWVIIFLPIFDQISALNKYVHQLVYLLK